MSDYTYSPTDTAVNSPLQRANGMIDLRYRRPFMILSRPITSEQENLPHLASLFEEATDALQTLSLAVQALERRLRILEEGMMN